MMISPRVSHPVSAGISGKHLGGLIEELAEPRLARQESALRERRGGQGRLRAFRLAGHGGRYGRDHEHPPATRPRSRTTPPTPAWSLWSSSPATPRWRRSSIRSPATRPRPPGCERRRPTTWLTSRGAGASRRCGPVDVFVGGEGAVNGPGARSRGVRSWRTSRRPSRRRPTASAASAPCAASTRIVVGIGTEPEREPARRRGVAVAEQPRPHTVLVMLGNAMSGRVPQLPGQMPGSAHR